MELKVIFNDYPNYETANVLLNLHSVKFKVCKRFFFPFFNAKVSKPEALTKDVLRGFCQGQMLSLSGELH